MRRLPFDRGPDQCDVQTPDADLIREYFYEANKKRVVKSRSVKHLRWIVPVVVGLTPLVPEAATMVPDLGVAAPALAGALTTADQLVLSRFMRGWKPTIFVDDKLRPFVSRQ